MIKIILLSLSLSFVCSNSYAHGGHDHNAPTAIVPLKGGVVKALEQTNVEVVSKGKDIKIYLFDKQSKPQDVAPYTVSAKAEMPRTKKIEDILLKPMGNFYEASFDAKGVHRYTLLLTIIDPKTGHNDKLQFTIEPSRESKETNKK